MRQVIKYLIAKPRGAGEWRGSGETGHQESSEGKHAPGYDFRMLEGRGTCETATLHYFCVQCGSEADFIRRRMGLLDDADDAPP